MKNTKKRELSEVETILKGFAERTGITAEDGDARRRYLWTDAFAVQCFFAMHRITREDHYQNMALKLIEEVHNTLGKHHRDDERSGWISGLNETEGNKHPTKNGLRIGKKLPERKLEEHYDQQIEWDRDGQYFHYLTRWINALYQAEFQCGDQQYGKWAAELCLAGEKFIAKSKGRLYMHWKMSTDLTRPLIPSMGAHDPIEGLICTLTTQEKYPDLLSEKEQLLSHYKELCTDKNWATSDSLGLGGLFLNIVRAAELQQRLEVPKSIQAQTLLQDALHGLQSFATIFAPENPAFSRLPFRECGLALGLRVLCGQKKKFEKWGLDISEFQEYIAVASEIESFWSMDENQSAHTWTDHLDINEISLASSIIAKTYPEVFANLEEHPTF